MSDAVVLALRAPVERPIAVEFLAPDRLATLAEREIAALPVWQGTREAMVGDFFDVRGGRAAHVRVEGDLARVHGLGAGMKDGELLIDGRAGDDVGRDMAGGTLVARGGVGDGAGAAMRGGVLDVHGDAGDRLGSAHPGAARGMTGGEIVVRGAAGRDAGALSRRGLVVVGGDAGEGAGARVIAGSIVVFGSAAAGAGRSSKRGTVVAFGAIDVPSIYRYACTYAPPHLALTLTYLQRRYGLPIDERHVMGRYRRYSGDLAELGKGEILQWTDQ